jgi:tight adherence protein B
MPSIAGNSFLVLAVLIFTAIALLLEGLYLLWTSRHGAAALRIRSRIQALSGAPDKARQARLLKQRALNDVPGLERRFLAFRGIRGLDRYILQAGLCWPVSRLLGTCAAAGAAGWIVVSASLHQPMLVGAVAGVLVAALPVLYVQRRRNARLARIEAQLPDTLDLITRALRAGHAFSSALKMAGEETSDPIAQEFRTVHDEVSFGVDLQLALTHLSERVPLTDMRYFVVAVVIQRDSGGNLTEVLANLSRLIRERAKLQAKVRVLSSEGRLSAWILVLLPFLLGGGMYLANPKFMSPLWTDPIGIAMLKWLLGMMLAGILILRSIVRIRV